VNYEDVLREYKAVSRLTSCSLKHTALFRRVSPSRDYMWEVSCFCC